MDLESLNKTQIILLVLLVSFVTSIATGIVTVTLMDQAPPAITHTISKVVQTTVEKVTPQETQTATVVETVVVKEENLIADAVSRNKNKVVAITTSASEEGSSTTPQAFIGHGFLYAPNTIITDASLVTTEGEYVVIFNNGTVINPDGIESIYVNEATGIAFITYKLEGEHQTPKPVNTGDATALTLGETVISVVGGDRERVRSGIISELNTQTHMVQEEDPKTGETVETQTKILTNIYTTAQLSREETGIPLLNLDGETVGLNLVTQDGSYAVPAHILSAELERMKAAQGEDADEGDA